MKKILSIIFILWAGFVSAQSVGQFRYDTTKFLKVGGYNEVKIQNNTMDSVGGIFTNIGAGWGKWIKPKQISPGVIVIGLDTFTISGGSSTDTTRTLYSSDSTIILTYNTARDSINVQVDTNRVATKLFVTNIFNSDTTAKTDPEAIQSITAITDTSFENVHGNGDRDTVPIRGKDLQGAFDNNPTAIPTINARGNTIQFDSLNTLVFNFIEPVSPFSDVFSSSVVSGTSVSSLRQGLGQILLSTSTDAGDNAGELGATPTISYLQNNNLDLSHSSKISTQIDGGYSDARISSTDSVIVNSPLTYFTGGNVGIGTTTPDSTLHLVGGLKLDLPSKGNGKVLTSDANGAATWQTMTSGAAAAGTLTGTTLASNVVSSSLTGLGTVVTGVWHGTSIDTLYSSGVSNINVNSPLVKLAQGKGYLITADTSTGADKLITQGSVSRTYAPLLSPSLTTPTIGVATATSINKVAITAPATSATLTILNGKTLTANNSLTLAGTDGTTITFPTTSATIARTDAAQTFVGSQIVSGSFTASNLFTTAGGAVIFGARGGFDPSADGVMRIYNNAANGFNRLCLGLATSSFPAWSRNGATAEAVLGDASGFAATQSLYDRFGSGSPEGVVTAPIGATYHRTDGGANTSLYVKESGAGNTGWIAK